MAKKKKNRPKFPNGYNKSGQVKPKKPTTVDRFKKILTTTLEKQIQRLNQNKGLLKNYKEGSFKYNRLQSKIEKNQFSIDQLKKQIETMKYKKRYSNKILNTYEQLMWINLQVGSEGYIKMDRETNFKRLILNLLAEEGVDIYDPTQVVNFFKVADFDTIYRNWLNYSAGDNFYDDIKEIGILEFIERYSDTEKLKDIKEMARKWHNSRMKQ